jgi:DNA primase
MSIDFNRFRRWVESRFDDVKISGQEIRINSIFTDDDKQHLWLNPYGGKKQRKNGVYHCFKTDRKGTLVNFVQLVDHCDREDAVAILHGQTSIRDLERQLEEFFDDQEEKVIEEVKPDLQFPAGTYLISDCKKWWRNKAEEYLATRKIPSDGLYFCVEQPYKGRIIIPYYDRQGKLIYWNSRHIFPQSKLRYLGPPKEVGIGKSDVIYFPGGWPKSGELLHVCEGEFNALSLKLSGLWAAACGGKNMSDKQALMLADYCICLCLDRDKAGKAGTSVMSNAVTMLESASKTKDKLFCVRPPVPYKDWNEMYIAEGSTMVYHYIKRNARPLTYYFPQGMGSAWTHFIDF